MQASILRITLFIVVVALTLFAGYLFQLPSWVAAALAVVVAVNIAAVFSLWAVTDAPPLDEYHGGGDDEAGC